MDFVLPSDIKDISLSDCIIVRRDIRNEQERWFQTVNRYDVIINNIQSESWSSLLRLEEDSSIRTRILCCSARPFRMRGVNANHTIMMLKRPLRCPAPTGSCHPYAQEITVEIPCGVIVGSVTQAAACCNSVFKLTDADGKTHLLIKGPVFAYHCYFDLAFKVYSATGGRSIGRVIRQWRENRDIFHITFPHDLHSLMKLLLICSAVLIGRYTSIGHTLRM
ncbi:unnamed protein product [Dicrocoelium dendriticum]|nr:unnamed protein product [Dicrocoelium dendriticum]